MLNLKGVLHALFIEEKCSPFTICHACLTLTKYWDSKCYGSMWWNALDNDSWLFSPLGCFHHIYFAAYFHAQNILILFPYLLQNIICFFCYFKNGVYITGFLICILGMRKQTYINSFGYKNQWETIGQTFCQMLFLLFLTVIFLYISPFFAFIPFYYFPLGFALIISPNLINRY